MCPKRIGNGKERIIIQRNRRGTLHVTEEVLHVPEEDLHVPEEDWGW